MSWQTTKYRPQDGQDWMTTKEAAALLEVTVTRIIQMTKAGELSSFEPPNSSASRFYLRRDIEALASRRRQEQTAQRKTNLYKAWEVCEQRQPPPAGEVLLTSPQAAQRLNVAEVTLLLLAYRGRLPCYQLRAGKAGSPLRFAVSDVERLEDDAERGKRRAAYEQRFEAAGLEEQEPPLFELPQQIRQNGDEPWYSDWLTTGQVAAKLGVHPNRVLQLIKTKRLPAVQLPKKYYNRRPWCVRRADVEKFMADADYQARHARWQAANTPELCRERREKHQQAAWDALRRANDIDNKVFMEVRAWPDGVW